MIGKPVGAPLSGQGAMKNQMLLVVVMLAGCSNASGAGSSLAQCQLDAESPSGLAFRKSRMGADFNRYAKSYDYNVFMIKCMQARGYSFPREGEKNYAGCWSKEVDASGVNNPAVDSPACYTKR